jgi:hypothetical protein
MGQKILIWDCRNCGARGDLLYTLSSLLQAIFDSKGWSGQPEPVILIPEQGLGLEQGGVE